MAGRARAGYSCYKFACVQYSVDLHDIVLGAAIFHCELRVQPTPDGSDSSIASSVDFDTTFFFLLFSEKATRAGDAKQRK